MLRLRRAFIFLCGSPVFPYSTLELRYKTSKNSELYVRVSSQNPTSFRSTGYSLSPNGSKPSLWLPRETTFYWNKEFQFFLLPLLGAPMDLVYSSVNSRTSRFLCQKDFNIFNPSNSQKLKSFIVWLDMLITNVCS